jgi:hypothetical protein
MTDVVLHVLFLFQTDDAKIFELLKSIEVTERAKEEERKREALAIAAVSAAVSQ